MSENKDQKIIVRFPPSPTGFLHVGNVRTALYNYFFAKKNQGEFIVRVEDTDKARSKKEYEEDMFENLKWLGLTYDPKKVLRQSERTEIYKEKIQELIKKGAAYISEETEGENKEVVRFKNPGGKIKFQDLIRGDVEMEVGDLNDFIIARNINEPVYHLTVVVDDMESEVTHVIRGEDHISNTPRQILILEALGGTRPIYAHLPLMLASDKSKLSKRKHGEMVSLKYYREKEYLPEAMINFLSMIGWNPGGEEEIFSLSELIEKFDLSKVQKAGAVFNIEKLDWLNKEYMKKMSEDSRTSYILEKLKSNPGLNQTGAINDIEYVKKITPIIFDRISKWSDIDTLVGEGELTYYFEAPVYEKDKLCWKEQLHEEAGEHLKYVVNKLTEASEENFNSAEQIKTLIFDYAMEKGRGEVLWPLRVALSGRDKSPDPFTLIYILGKNESIDRINKAIEKLS
jgi:glutamyl-tRNA synthetase